MDATNKKYLFSPLLDFILLGGGSLILFPLVMFALPAAHIHTYHLYPVFVSLSVYIGYVANMPHLLYSYQLIYQDFLKKVSGGRDKQLQVPYVWAGIIVPMTLAILFSYCYIKHNFMLFGFMVNISLLISGWHYAKQGFGVLIVTSIYQKIFYAPVERLVLIWNANILWAYLWIMFNSGLRHQRSYATWYYTLGFPKEMQMIFFYLSCFGLLCSIFVLVKKYLRESIIPPISGIAGYVTPLYFWLVLLRYMPSAKFIHPVVLLVPAMHAIQYMAIVFKMKQNEVKCNKMTTVSLAIFIGMGVILGVLSFVAIPRFLDKTFTAHGPLYESIFWVAIFAVFINIHHFFIDNVIWRKENREVKDYLYNIH